MNRGKRIYDFGTYSTEHSIDDIVNQLHDSSLFERDELETQMKNIRLSTSYKGNLLHIEEIMDFLYNFDPNNFNSRHEIKKLKSNVNEFKQYTRKPKSLEVLTSSPHIIEILKSIFMGLQGLILYSSRPIENYNKLSYELISGVFNKMFFVPSSGFYRQPSSYVRKQIDKLSLGVEITTEMIIYLELSMLILSIKSNYIDNVIKLIEDIRLSYIDKVKKESVLIPSQFKLISNYISGWDSETGTLKKLAAEMAKKYQKGNRDFNFVPYKNSDHITSIRSKPKRSYRKKPY